MHTVVEITKILEAIKTAGFIDPYHVQGIDGYERWYARCQHEERRMIFQIKGNTFAEIIIAKFRRLCADAHDKCPGCQGTRFFPEPFEVGFDCEGYPIERPCSNIFHMRGSSADHKA